MKNSDPIFYPSNTEEFKHKQQRDKNYSDSINILQTQWYQADVDQRFYLGDQELWSQIYAGVGDYRRKTFNFNIINPIVQSIAGFQRQTRKSTVCIPRQQGLQQTADQFSKCLYYVHNKSDGYQVYSDAFEQGALVQGIGLISIFKDLRDDPVSGDVGMRYVDFKSVLIDPFFRKKDLSDCRYIWTRQFFDREEAIQMFPQIKDNIMNNMGNKFRDDKFYYMPEVYELQFKNLVAIDEYWYLSTRMATYMVDTETGEMQEFTGDEEDFRVVSAMFGKRLKLTKKDKQTVRRQILVNDTTAIDEPDPYGMDSYPYIPVLGYFTPDTAYYALKFRGVVRDMRDAQYLFNRRKVADLDILESQQQGLIVENGSLVKPDDALNSGHGRVLVRKKGSDPASIQPMDIRPPSPVMLQMEEMLMDVAHRIAGVDPKAMGIEVDDKAGIISMMRHAATARNLQGLFDNLDFAQRLAGEKIIKFIQKNWTTSKIQNVIGEEPTNEFENKLFFQYGCKVIQSALTETQEQLELAQILEYQRLYPQLDLSQEVLDAMQIQNKDQLKEKLAQQAMEQKEQEQQMAQLQMQQMQVDNEMKLSYASSEKGKAIERQTKAQENEARAYEVQMRGNTEQAEAYERLRRSQEEETSALLNLVKSIKEIENMDLEQVKRKMEILKSLDPNIEPETVEEKAETLDFVP